MTLRIPSIKSLEPLCEKTVCTPKQLRRALKVGVPNLENEEFWKKLGIDVPRVRGWVHSCCHPPFSSEIRMAIADELLEGYGVESIDRKETKTGRSILYSNQGDTYTLTLCRTCKDTYRVCCWGDLIK